MLGVAHLTGGRSGSTTDAGGKAADGLGSGEVKTADSGGAALAGGASGAVGGKDGVSFVYPYGATLNVQKPAVTLLSSGFISCNVV